MAACLIGASNTHLSAATFSDDNWNGIGNIDKVAPVPYLTGGVRAVATDRSGNLYVGGDFTIAGGVSTTNIAQWNGSTWSALNWQGMNGPVGALLAVGNELYAGGQFTAAGGVSATNIAKWNGSHWSPVGSGINPIITQPYYAGYVGALAMSGSDLYVAGFFTNASGIPVNHIAKWDGRTWSAVGSGMNHVVVALAVSGSNVYAGGAFTMTGGSSANYIARWNGSSWSALGSGMDGAVYSLAVMGSDLYAGGYFKTAGGVSATDIARWDGTNWTALGFGIRFLDGVFSYNGAVNALAVSGNELYAAGNYTRDSVDVNRIAKWNGTSWTALGSQFSWDVSSLAVRDTDLYAGGSFGSVGGVEAWCIAKARIGSAVKSIAAANSNSTAIVQCSGVTGYQYGVQRTTSLNSPLWTTINSNPISPAANGTFTFTDTNTPSGGAFYRTSLIPPAIPACPLLGLQQPAGTDLTNGYSDFPSRVYIGEATEGDSVTKTFTITNCGDAPMTINSVRMGDVGIFEVDTTGMLTNVPAGGSTTFTVTFYPWELGEHADELLVSTSVAPGCFGLNLGYFQVIVTGVGL